MNQPPTIIQALSSSQQQQIIDQTHAYIKQAVELFNINSKPIDIVFNLKGRSAGMYKVSSSHFFSQKKREIRYNSYIFSKYFDDNFNTTIPHEVAHYISDIIHGLKNIKPHGKEWQAVMQAFDADASVTANYDLTGIPVKKQSLHAYQCSCREHQLSSTRHNKIIKQQYRYYCKCCKQALKYKQPATLLNNKG